MKKFTLVLCMSVMALFARTGFEYDGVLVKNVDEHNKTTMVKVKREIPERCNKVKLNNDTLWTGTYVRKSVPSECTGSYLKTAGKIQPMFIDSEVETYGELEVLSFMKDMKHDDNLLLVDSRKSDWFEYRTIPGAINVPFQYFKRRELNWVEFDKALKQFGVTIKDDEYDFEKAKTLVLFCNASWCSQSVAMARALLEIDYPPENIKWYRGGLQCWLSSGLTSTKD